MLCNRPGVYLYFLGYLPVCQLLSVYSGRMVWSCPELMAEGLSLGLGLWFLVVPNCHPRVLRFRVLQIGSVIVLYFSGPFAPPKLSLSEMSMYNFPFQFI